MVVVNAGPGAAREILVVLALAVVGLLLALIAAFTPWYDVARESDHTRVVEMHAPTAPPESAQMTAAGAR